MNTQKNMTLGSLFDGIGGFPYAGTFFGITPVWASEILPSAVSVTNRHLPNMAHVGDITKLDGAKLPPVDIISFGSPCQGLSMAGKRLGLADERSGLFGEAIRIINEMREATDGKYPRYALWENVPGALSSGTPHGSDFKAVLEAFTKTSLSIPQSGRWANAGMVRSGGIDLAWIIYDAQRFGTAQRRRRIFLVVDFGGKSAGEILFVPQSLRGYFAAGGTPRQGPAAYAAGGAECADGSGCTGGAPLISEALPAIAMRIRQGCEGGGKGPLLQTERSGTLATGNDQTLFSPCMTPWDSQSRRIHDETGTWPALYGGEGGGRGYVARDDGKKFSAGVVSKGNGDCFLTPERHTSLTRGGGQAGQGYPCVLTTAVAPDTVCLNDQGGQRMDVEKGEQAPTLRSVTKGNLPVICRATALANAETLVDKSPTLTCYHEQPILCKAIHQNQDGNVTTSDAAYSLTTASNASSRNAPLVACGFDLQQITSKQNRSSLKEVQPTLCAGGSPHVVLSGSEETETQATAETYAIAATAIGRQPHNGGNGLGINKDISPTLTATDRHAVTGAVHPEVSGTLCASGVGLSRPAGMASETDLCVAYSLQGNMLGRSDENGPEGAGVNEDVSYTLNTRDQHGVAAADCQNPVRTGYIVRRLTPTECERLQGFPDGWTALDEHGKPISDSKRYQMLGNSVAVPCVAYILRGMAKHLQKED